MSKKAFLKATVWGAAIALPLSVIGASTANALPYAYASNVDSNFVITGFTGTTGVPATTPPTAAQLAAVPTAPGGQLTANGYYVASSQFTTTDSITSTGGTTYGTPPAAKSATSSSGTGASVGQQTFGPGPFPAATVYTESLTPGSTAQGVRASAADSGFAGNGANVAEGHFIAQPSGANAQSSVTLTSSTVNVVVAAGTELQVSFNDLPGLEAYAGTNAGSYANASISSSVVITGANGTTYLSFSPTGSVAADNILGGINAPGSTTFCDATNLNNHLTSQSPAGTDLSGSGTAGNPNPASGTCTSTIVTGTTPSGQTVTASNPYLFAAITAGLPAGSYTISINQTSVISLTAGVPVPEPASIALLGAGLIGLGALRRKGRRKA